MSDLIDVIIKTRKTAADIFVKSLIDINGKSEVEIKKKILSEIKNHHELFPGGWYDPPPDGICVLLGQKPFKRLQFETLRKPVAWPNEAFKFEKETVGIFYISPVDRKTGMVGDKGLTIYNGDDKEVREHLQRCYDITFQIAEKAKVGMKFSELYKVAYNLFKDNLKMVGWMTTTNDPNLGVNLGHTLPGSLEDDLNCLFPILKTYYEVEKGVW